MRCPPCAGTSLRCHKRRRALNCGVAMVATHREHTCLTTVRSVYQLQRPQQWTHSRGCCFTVGSMLCTTPNAIVLGSLAVSLACTLACLSLTMIPYCKPLLQAQQFMQLLALATPLPLAGCPTHLAPRVRALQLTLRAPPLLQRAMWPQGHCLRGSASVRSRLASTSC